MQFYLVASSSSGTSICDVCHLRCLRADFYWRHFDADRSHQNVPFWRWSWLRDVQPHFGAIVWALLPGANVALIRSLTGAIFSHITRSFAPCRVANLGPDLGVVHWMQGL